MSKGKPFEPFEEAFIMKHCIHGNKTRAWAAERLEGRTVDSVGSCMYRLRNNPSKAVGVLLDEFAHRMKPPECIDGGYLK
jgi:hypothetical protein